jgi:predicted outer membrane repeat protein
MKKLSVFALVAALLTGACGLGGVSGTINYDEVTVNLTSTLYVSRDVVAGAALEGEDDFNTSCSNTFDAVGEETDVAGILTALVLVAYEEDFGVVHLCAGTYETDEIIQFPNLGSITIEGDGMDETIIRGIGADHALLAMVPADCLPQEPEDLCPSYFNVLTLKDLTLADGVGDTDGFVLEDFVLEDEEASDVLFSTGGAVTAPRVATERVRFSNNSAPCGGAISLYGWTQLITENIGEGESDEVEYLSSLILPGTSQIIDTEFIENSAEVGGAIGGAYLDGEEVGEGLYGCINSGPLNIVNSTFEGNSTTNLDSVSGVSVGGAIATASLIFLFLELVGGGGNEEDVVELFNQDVWLSISSSTFTDNYAAAAGGAVFSYAKTSISRTTFMNNGVDSLDEGSTGGAIVVAGELSLSYSKLVGNSASAGGAVALIDVLGGGHVFTRNTFTSNVATDQGGAISGWTDAGSARGNRFTSNRAPVGSAVAVETERCSRSVSRREARDWRGNTFRQNRGGRLPVECYVGGQG